MREALSRGRESGQDPGPLRAGGWVDGSMGGVTAGKAGGEDRGVWRRSSQISLCVPAPGLGEAGVEHVVFKATFGLVLR